MVTTTNSQWSSNGCVYGLIALGFVHVYNTRQ